MVPRDTNALNLQDFVARERGAARREVRPRSPLAPEDPRARRRNPENGAPCWPGGLHHRRDFLRARGAGVRHLAPACAVEAREAVAHAGEELGVSTWARGFEESQDDVALEPARVPKRRPHTITKERGAAEGTDPDAAIRSPARFEHDVDVGLARREPRDRDLAPRAPVVALQSFLSADPRHVDALRLGLGMAPAERIDGRANR